MSHYQNFLIQKVLHEGQEVDMSFLIESTVVETIDLSGPRIVMKFNDQFSLIRDVLKIRPGSILEIVVPMGDVISDPNNPTLDEAYEDYRVLSMPVTAKGEVILNCMHKDMWEWKQPIVNPRIYRRWNPVDIIKDWEPSHNRWDYVYDEGYNSSNSFPVTEDYHFLPGERPSLTIGGQMAMEHAACFFLTRGERFHCKAKRRIVKPEPIFTYDHYDETWPKDVEFGPLHGQILFYARPYNNSILEDLMVRRYMGFSMIDGPMYATKNVGYPLQFRPQKYQISIDNLNVNLIPVVEFTASGNAYLVAGAMLKLNWYQSDMDHPIDESLPPKALAATVIHYYSAQKYNIRVKCLNLADWVEDQ